MVADTNFIDSTDRLKFRTMPRWLVLLNAVAGVVFVFLGVKGYWDWDGWWPLVALLATLALGMVAVLLARRFRRPILAS